MVYYHVTTMIWQLPEHHAMLEITSHGRLMGNDSRNRSSQPPLEHAVREGCVIPQLGWWCIGILAWLDVVACCLVA
eukprot:4935521-Prymnesium_polylepis.1